MLSQGYESAFFGALARPQCAQAPLGWDIIRVYKDHGISRGKGKRHGQVAERAVFGEFEQAAVRPDASLTW